VEANATQWLLSKSKASRSSSLPVGAPVGAPPCYSYSAAKPGGGALARRKAPAGASKTQRAYASSEAALVLTQAVSEAAFRAGPSDSVMGLALAIASAC
jgi:hypothetical protein